MNTAHDEVRALLSKMRARVEYLTKRPIDPDFDNLTFLMETITSGYMTPVIHDEWWAQYGLTPLERKVMQVLSVQAGRCVSYQALYNALYFDRHECDEPQLEITKVLVANIRKKISQSEHAIVSSWGEGYKLVPRADDTEIPPQRALWNGILMGSLQAKLAAALHEHLGEPVAYARLVSMTGDYSVAHLIRRANSLRRHLSETAFTLETVAGLGYRMHVRKVHATP